MRFEFLPETWVFHLNSSMQRADISRDNPTKVFDLIQKIGSGTYGDVYKVKIVLKILWSWNYLNISMFVSVLSFKPSFIHE